MADEIASKPGITVVAGEKMGAGNVVNTFTDQRNAPKPGEAQPGTTTNAGGLPSADDLDAVAAETLAAELTSSPSGGAGLAPLFSVEWTDETKGEQHTDFMTLAGARLEELEQKNNGNTPVVRDLTTGEIVPAEG